MPFAKRTRRLTLLVLAAYLAANTLGVLWHERLHAHAPDVACCHADAEHTHAGHTHASHARARHDHPGLRFPTPQDDSAGSFIAADTHDHNCVVCRVVGQPVVAAVVVELARSTAITADLALSPAAAPRSLSARLAQSRAPPSATI